MLPSPSQLINAPKFDSWFPGQEELVLKVMQWLKGDKRFLCANVPTGFGKSIVAIVSGWLNGDKVVYLTYTKGLQDQLMADFEGPVGMVSVKGQNNYTCIDAPPARVDEGKCHAGITCQVRSECTYYQAMDDAIDGRVINTNYSYWLAQNYYTKNGLLATNELGEVEGTYPLVIMDEAHLAGRALEQHLTVHLGDMEYTPLGWEPEEMKEWTWEEWQIKCRYKHGELSHEANELARELKIKMNRTDLRRYSRLRSLMIKIGTIGSADIEWVREWAGSSVSLCPVWPSHYNGRLLIGDKILLMSGTLTRKSVEKLGIPEDECEWIDSPSPFDPKNSPVTQVNIGFRLQYNTPPENMAIWARVIDQIVEKQGNRKGILFTVSYPRAELYHRLSSMKDVLVTHHPRNTLEKVEYFKRKRGPALLVSPSVTSGWDFPDTECEYIIIGKVPFITTTGELTKARQKEDKEWGAFLAMETIVQEAGRGTRLMSDHCEVFIVDDHWTWFWPKFKHFSPRWFQDRVTRPVTSIPDRR